MSNTTISCYNRRMLTEKEQALIDKITSLVGDFNEIAKDGLEEGFEPYNGDNIELCMLIHWLQDKVLANMASRVYKGKYRLYGCKFSKEAIEKYKDGRTN